MGGVVPLALVASETKVAVSVAPEPSHIEPAVSVSCGALSVRLSSDSMPVDDKLMLVLSDSMPPFNDKSPVQLSDNGPAVLHVWTPEQVVF